MDHLVGGQPSDRRPHALRIRQVDPLVGRERWQVRPLAATESRHLHTALGAERRQVATREAPYPGDQDHVETSSSAYANTWADPVTFHGSTSSALFGTCDRTV